MSKQSPLGRPLPNASLPRNTYDRSFLTNFNQSSGMILPLFCQFVPLGTKFRLNRSLFMRTKQLNTAAFPEIDFNIDFYVVPLPLLMSRYDEFKTNTCDVNSSSLANINPNLNRVPYRLPYFKLSDMQAAVMDQQTMQTIGTDILGDPIYYGAERLFDMLGYDDRNLDSRQTNGYDVELNAIKLMAYQKVYYDHYRNTAYEQNDPFAYNGDYWYTGNNIPARITDPRVLRQLVTLRYVNYRKDYFQSIYPSLNYVSSGVEGNQQPWNLPNSVVGLIGISSLNTITSGFDNGRWTDNNGNTLPGNANISTRPNGASLDAAGLIAHHTHDVPVQINTDPSLYNVQAIRAAFALDKLMRASAYAPKHVKDQLEARFGVKLRQSYGNESIYIGSFGNKITIGEVTSTANTSSQSGGDDLGAIGGKGVSGSNGGKPIEYMVESDSIVIGVSYALARSMYDSFRLDSFNLKSVKEDLPIPEFMDLGLKPITVQEQYNMMDVNKNNNIIGYQTRDQEFKVSIDENHGLFRTNGQLSMFTMHNNAYSRLWSSGAFVAPTAAYFKVYPDDMNTIFTTGYDPTDQSYDQFFGQVRFDFSCRQNMSIHGQPKL